MNRISVTEYKRPNGERLERQFELPDPYYIPANILAKRGYEFSLEVLSGSPLVIPEKSVYMEVWKHKADPDEQQAIANILCHPKGVQHALQKLIYEAIRFGPEKDLEVPPDPNQEPCGNCSHPKIAHMLLGQRVSTCSKKDCTCNLFRSSFT